MAYIVVVQDPNTGERRRLEAPGATTAEAIVQAGRMAPGMRVLDVRPREEAVRNTAAEPEFDAIDFDEPDGVLPENEDLASAATDEPTIEWRRARPAIMPYVATLAVGIAAGGAGALWLTDGFETLLERAETVATGGAPSDETPQAPMDTVHASDGGPATTPSTTTDPAGLPPQTIRIADASGNGSTVYRVITRHEATGYLYETLVRADTSAEAASWCASRTQMEVVRVERVADAAS